MSWQQKNTDMSLARWIEKELGLRGTVAASPAPVWANDTCPDHLQAALERLDNSLNDDEIDFSPQARYAASLLPEANRLLRRFEGLPPGALAVLKPTSPEHLAQLAGKVRAAGFNLASALLHRPDPQTLPVDLGLMRRVDVLSRADGLLEMQAGASWADLRTIASDNDLAAPSLLEDKFPSPATAARAGFLEIVDTSEVAGITTSYHLCLPPAGTRWLERIWLFSDETKARQAFQRVCRQGQVCYAEFIDCTRFAMMNAAGLVRLPGSWRGASRYYGLRLVFEGPFFAALSAEFAASWPLESAGSFQWKDRKVPPSRDLIDASLQNGLTMVTAEQPTTWADLATCEKRISKAMQRAAIECPAPVPCMPLLIPSLVYVGNRIHLSVSLLTVKDHEQPLAQWENIHASAGTSAGKEALTSNSPLTEESPEWQAIRQALVDEDGNLRSIPPHQQATLPEARHG